MADGRKAVLVVGGGRGIGRAAARGLAGDGYAVTVWDALADDAADAAVADRQTIDIGDRDLLARAVASLSEGGRASMR